MVDSGSVDRYRRPINRGVAQRSPIEVSVGNIEQQEDNRTIYRSRSWYSKRRSDSASGSIELTLWESILLRIAGVRDDRFCEEISIEARTSCTGDY